MKAEHRKELETNLLADRMGTFIQGMRGGPQRSTIIIALLLVVAIAAGVVAYFMLTADDGSSTRWMMLSLGEVGPLIQDADNNSTKKAALFEKASYELWYGGILFLGSNPGKSLTSLDRAEDVYRELLTICKGEVEWEAEAKYALAVIEETRTAIDAKKLAEAKKMYEELATDKEFKETRHGKLAIMRVKDLTDNKDSITAFYRDLKKETNIEFWDKIRRMKGGGKGGNLNLQELLQQK